MAATFCEEVAPLPTDGLPAPADDDEAVLSAGMANDWCMVGEEMGWKKWKKTLKTQFHFHDLWLMYKLTKTFTMAFYRYFLTSYDEEEHFSPNAI